MTQTSGPDPLEFLKALWGPMGLPAAGFVVPTLDAAELERRVSELRAVEAWLNMNLALLRMTIQGMEMQQATLAALKGAEKMGVPPGVNSIFDAWVSALQKQGVQPPPDSDKEK